LAKTLNFNYHIDPSKLLSDKVFILRKSEWTHEYDSRCAQNLYPGWRHYQEKTTNRVLVKYLTEFDTDVEKIIRGIEQGALADKEKVMVAIAKEREFKKFDARCFAKMTFNMRLYQTATESNIAESIFPLIKYQSMTMDEVTLLKTISQMCETQMFNRNNRFVFITVDFSKWCSPQTWASLTRVFQEFDNLFGLDRVFSYTQLFPIESLLLYQSKFHPPGQDHNGLPYESSTSTHLNNKWLEGLRQKGWTLVTLCLILHVAMTEETTTTLLGQGDNQVIVLKIPPDDVLRRTGQSVSEYIKGFLDHLKAMSTRMGMIIKPEETWSSTCLVEYSKKYHLRGTQVSCGFKRASKYLQKLMTI
jgi:hypothetical protein